MANKADLEKRIDLLEAEKKSLEDMNRARLDKTARSVKSRKCRIKAIGTKLRYLYGQHRNHTERVRREKIASLTRGKDLSE